MKNAFPNPRLPDPAEQFLRDLGCVFEKQPDGTLVVEGDVKISYLGLTELPDLSAVVVKGSFHCNDNRLTSLKGCPRAVGRDFWCHANALTSLEGAPETVGYNFWCHINNLKSLEGAPEKIGGYFYCGRNELESLEGAPRSFIRLTSDFGDFDAWAEVPEAWRLSPATTARLADEKTRQEEARLHAEAQQILREKARKNPVRLKKP